MKEKTEIVVGIMSILVVLYRIITFMMPMIKEGIKKNDLGKILASLSLIV